MLRKFIARKRNVVVLTALAALAVAGGAFAYFSSTGAGSGSATVGSSTNFKIAEGTVSGATSLFPDAAVGGDYVQSHPITVTNPGSGSENLATFTVKVANANGSDWSAQADSTKPACTASDFSVDGLTAGTADDITSLHGDYTAGSDKTATVTVEMIDDKANQDNCQGVTVPLYYSAS